MHSEIPQLQLNTTAFYEEKEVSIKWSGTGLRFVDGVEPPEVGRFKLVKMLTNRLISKAGRAIEPGWVDNCESCCPSLSPRRYQSLKGDHRSKTLHFRGTAQ